MDSLQEGGSPLKLQPSPDCIGRTGAREARVSLGLGNPQSPGYKISSHTTGWLGHHQHNICYANPSALVGGELRTSELWPGTREPGFKPHICKKFISLSFKTELLDKVISTCRVTSPCKLQKEGMIAFSFDKWLLLWEITNTWNSFPLPLTNLWIRYDL
jgi:hypothetical protein